MGLKKADEFIDCLQLGVRIGHLDGICHVFSVANQRAKSSSKGLIELGKSLS
ncbi:hypothetical protein CGSSpSV36_0289 [Streptococcus pneumoniae SV36]|nr:hypothetical protein CGSSpSV36_0289 [Streptococcus pneumoniae SV36]